MINKYILVVLFKNSLRNPVLIYKAVLLFFKVGSNAVRDKIVNKFVIERSLKINEQYKIWFSNNYPNHVELDKERTLARGFGLKPKISIITPVFNTPSKLLRECIESVLKQSYQNWELCLVDDASTNLNVRKIISSYEQKDKRIKTHFRNDNGHICQASNDCLQLATGEFVGLLDHDDFLWPNALFEVVSVINRNPKVQFIYTDEDKLEENGKSHSDPFFKPDWNPDYLRTANYITHFSVIKKELVDRVGGFRLGYEGAQDWDLFLRATREIDDKRFSPTQKKIIHIPTVLYSWRKSDQSTASEKVVGKVKAYTELSQKKVLENDLKERGFSGKVLKISNLGYWRVRYDIINMPKISIVIPTKDKLPYISKCLNSILKLTTYRNFELIIVDTGSTKSKVFDLYKSITDKFPQTKILNWHGNFNFSEVCNLGVENSTGDYIVLLNNDTEIVTKGWIEGLLEHAQRSEIGAVGCKLLYTNKTIQHAGIILGIKGGRKKKGVAGHAFKYLQGDFKEKGMVEGVRDYSAVTAACLMINKKKYLEVGGLDPEFKIAFNDVDFNLKLLKRGYYNVYTGFVKLFHHESVSVAKPGSENRSMEVFQNEINKMHKRWGSLLQKDPFYNTNLTLDSEDFTLR